MLVNLNDVLIRAKKEHYAVGLFNVVDSDTLKAVISAAEEMNSPVILGTAERLLPYGDLQLLGPSFINLAKKSSIPVVVHFDHGLTFEKCMEALQLGFSSVMFDGSNGDFIKNMEKTSEIVRIAHAFGASVEGEIGHVGEAKNSDNAVIDRYTTVKEAQDFLNATGVDALAIAIGTAHGAYKEKPHLDLQRLRDISTAVDTPLVLHGGSGLTTEDFQNVIRDGISKINIFTDLCEAAANALTVGSKENLTYLEIKNKKATYIKEEVKKRIRIFGSENKA